MKDASKYLVGLCRWAGPSEEAALRGLEVRFRQLDAAIAELIDASPNACIVDALGVQARHFLKVSRDICAMGLTRPRAMTAEEAEEQRRSFVAGNCGIDNPLVTRELVDRVADGPKVIPAQGQGFRSFP